MKRHGFTLAEVLLTLAIIGVVAALTIPAVVAKITKDQYVVGLKKVYNTLKSVQREAEQENGPMENWNWTLSSKDSFEKYFKPHFDILKDCGASTDDGCFSSSGTYKYLDGSDFPADFNTATWYRIMSSDGISYAYQKESYEKGRQGLFYIDLNGKKEPNKWGRDVFYFDVFPTIGIKPGGAFQYYDVNEIIKSENVIGATGHGCNLTRGTGNYCATRVLSEGAMNY